MNRAININPAYREIINFLAAGITFQTLIGFQVSETV